MTEQEKKRTEEKRNALALHTVQTALDNGFSVYDIEKMAAERKERNLTWNLICIVHIAVLKQIFPPRMIQRRKI